MRLVCDLLSPLEFLRYWHTEWADLNPKSAFLKTGLTHPQTVKLLLPGGAVAGMEQDWERSGEATQQATQQVRASWGIRGIDKDPGV